VKKNLFRPREDNEELLSPEVSYFSVIGALMYFANNTQPDIAFFVNLLGRYNSSPPRRRWISIKYIFHYLEGNTYMSLFYSNDA